jgi:hypothetical protein
MAPKHRKPHQRHIAAKAIAAGATYDQAAEAAGVGSRTIDRWMKEPEFREMIAKAQETATSSMIERWERLSEEHFEAFRTVRELVDLQLAPILQRCLDAENSQTGEPLEKIANPSTILKLVQALAIAVDGERTALAMNYLDSNRAVAHVQQMGYVVSEKGEAIDVQARQA